MDAPHPSRRPDLPDVPIWAVATMRTAAEADSLGAAATHYAALGIPVFPCVPGAKHPLTRNGFHDATTSRPVVRDWWHRHPRANIGVPTGVVSGIVVVDVDVHAGASGFQAFESARHAEPRHRLELAGPHPVRWPPRLLPRNRITATVLAVPRRTRRLPRRRRLHRRAAVRD